MCRQPTQGQMRQARKVARNRAAEGPLSAALVAAAGAGCTTLILGEGTVNFLYYYFRFHNLIPSKGCSNAPDRTLMERKRNIFRALVRFARNILLYSPQRGGNK